METATYRGSRHLASWEIVLAILDQELVIGLQKIHNPGQTLVQDLEGGVKMVLYVKFGI